MSTKMFKILKRLLTTQFLSVLYSIITITIIELTIRVPGLYMLIPLDVIMIGFLCFFISRKFLDSRWLNIFLVCMPYIIYSIIVMGVYGAIFPIKGDDDNYALGLVILIDIIGCWVSIIIGMISSNVSKRFN
jgi:hypothetical protein